jgi:hypothetical protein
VNDGHAAGVRSLSTLAGLLGCSPAVPFADDRRPDVLSCDPSRLLLFVGEAKATERASDERAIARLRAYVVWIRAHLSGQGRSAVISLCSARSEDLDKWRDVLLRFATELGLPIPMVSSRQVDSETNMVMIWWSGQARLPR